MQTVVFTTSPIPITSYAGPDMKVPTKKRPGSLPTNSLMPKNSFKTSTTPIPTNRNLPPDILSSSPLFILFFCLFRFLLWFSRSPVDAAEELSSAGATASSRSVLLDCGDSGWLSRRPAMTGL